MTTPQPSEYAPYYGTYIQKVTNEIDILATLEAQIQTIQDVFGALTEAQGLYRYAPEKWSFKQVLGHINDTERVFAYRLLRFARGDAQSLAGFEQDDYVAASPAEHMSFADLIAEFTALRTANLLMIRHLSPETLQQSGIASGVSFSVNALIYILAGHVKHHVQIIEERYL